MSLFGAKKINKNIKMEIITLKCDNCGKEITEGSYFEVGLRNKQPTQVLNAGSSAVLMPIIAREYRRPDIMGDYCSLDCIKQKIEKLAEV